MTTNISKITYILEKMLQNDFTGEDDKIKHTMKVQF